MCVQTEAGTSRESCELTTVVPVVLNEHIPQHSHCAAEVDFQTDETVHCTKMSHRQTLHDKLDSKSYLTEMFLSANFAKIDFDHSWKICACG